MIERKRLRQRVADSLGSFRITALLGPRQCGKTTLARSFEVPRSHYFDLEDPVDLARLENSRDVLGGLDGLIVIDEFQRKPELLPVLRVLADRPDRPTRFLILGSASPSFGEGRVGITCRKGSFYRHVRSGLRRGRCRRWRYFSSAIGSGCCGRQPTLRSSSSAIFSIFAREKKVRSASMLPGIR